MIGALILIAAVVVFVVGVYLDTRRTRYARPCPSCGFTKNPAAVAKCLSCRGRP